MSDINNIKYVDSIGIVLSLKPKMALLFEILNDKINTSNKVDNEENLNPHKAKVINKLV